MWRLVARRFSLRCTYEVEHLQGSPTLAIKAMADKLKAQGKKVIDLGVGEMNPGIPVPGVLMDAMYDALKQGRTHYISEKGDPELKEAVSNDMRKNFNLNYTPEQILPFPGPKDALYHSLLGLLPHNEECNRVVTFVPTYESFLNVPFLLTGKQSIEVPTTGLDFQPCIPSITKLLQERSKEIKAIIVNSPNNPTGSVYTPHVLRQLAQLISQYPHIAVISDEVYRTLVYKGSEYTSIASFLPQQTVVVGGMSKEVSGTGLRLGFIAGPTDFVEKMSRVCGNTFSCVHTPTQRAYAKFLQHDSNLAIRDGIRKELEAKRDVFMSAFHSTPGLKECKLSTPKGAFYLFPDISAYLGRWTQGAESMQLTTDRKLSEYLVKEAGVVTIPGTEFHRPGHIRMAYAMAPTESLGVACDAIGKALAKLSPTKSKQTK